MLVRRPLVPAPVGRVASPPLAASERSWEEERDSPLRRSVSDEGGEVSAGEGVESTRDAGEVAVCRIAVVPPSLVSFGRSRPQAPVVVAINITIATCLKCACISSVRFISTFVALKRVVASEYVTSLMLAAGSASAGLAVLAGRESGEPVAYVCRSYSCDAPTVDPSVLRAQLRSVG